jgi:hypothetical protein
MATRWEGRTPAPKKTRKERGIIDLAQTPNEKLDRPAMPEALYIQFRESRDLDIQIFRVWIQTHWNKSDALDVSESNFEEMIIEFVRMKSQHFK